MPETRKKFWETKLNGNAERDKINMQRLADLGWRIFVIWECEIRKWDTSLENKILYFINHSIDESRFLYSDYKMPYQIAAESEPDYG
jgi:DNA mismatch endonuclease (patch repair protein)